jgi:hypothetical protein
MNRGNIFPIEPEAVRRSVAVNVLELSTSTECENDLQTLTTTLLCPRDMLFAYFDHSLSSVLVDGNVLMGPRLVCSDSMGQCSSKSLRSPVTAPRCPSAPLSATPPSNY